MLDNAAVARTKVVEGLVQRGEVVSPPVALDWIRQTQGAVRCVQVLLSKLCYDRSTPHSCACRRLLLPCERDLAARGGQRARATIVLM